MTSPAASLAFGCMSLKESALKEAVLAVEAALDSGITHFDNADIYPDAKAYGQSERVLGHALRELGVERESVQIASKASICPPGVVPGLPSKHYNTSSAWLLRQVDHSLDQLGTDYVDIFYLHRIDYLTPPEEIAATVEQLVKAGKIRSLGLSNYSVPEARALRQYLGDHIQALQMQFSLLHTAPLQDGGYALATEWGVPLYAWSPLASGRLGGGMPESCEWSEQRLAGVLTQLKPLQEYYDCSLPAFALAWLSTLPRVVPLLGTAKVQHLRASAGALELSIRRDHWYEALSIGLGSSLPMSSRPVLTSIPLS